MEETTFIRPETQTIGNLKLADFLQQRTNLRLVGFLNPLFGSGTERIPIIKDETTIGRDPSCNVALTDNGVSRLHARISRQKNEFVIIDLDSRNGTHVDGVPVVSCVLRGGDTVQVGRHLFLFDSMLQYHDDDQEDADE